MDYTVKVVIATHKEYKMPTDKLYLPLYVGAENKKNIDSTYAKDNTGDNISILNSTFCELTGLYWAWKNLDGDYIGLVHYRRHFSMKSKANFDSILTYTELKPYLGKIKVFIPKKRKYYIESLYNHYKHTHYVEHLDETRKIIAEKYPEYTVSYDKIIKHTYGYMFNMMIMENKLVDSYCAWLFDILFELKKRINISYLSTFQGRCYGRISEIIFNVWLEQKIDSNIIKKNEIMEIPYVHMEKVNWRNKGTAFLKAKFMGQKYEGSF